MGFVVVFETRVDVSSTFLFKSPTTRPPGAAGDGNIHGLSCMSLLLESSMNSHLEVFSCTLVICYNNDRVNLLNTWFAPVLGSVTGTISAQSVFITLASQKTKLPSYY